jgi:hypothetical protein
LVIKPAEHLAGQIDGERDAGGRTGHGQIHDLAVGMPEVGCASCRRWR